MRRTKTSLRRLSSFAVVAMLAVGLLLTGCVPPPPSPSSGPAVACAAPGGAQPLTVAEADGDARAAVAEAEADPGVRDADGDVRLLITEVTPDGPEFASVPVDSGDEAAAVARDAASSGDVVAVEPDVPVHALAAPPFPPDDSYFPVQWSLQQGTTTFGKTWSRATGEGAVVAVVDTGVDADHPDLVGRVLPGQNYVDPGWDHDPGPDPVKPPVGAMSPATDNNGHGTHVAGIVAASTNNDLGVAAAAPGASILPVKVLDSTGRGFVSWIASGITWAAANGADVINLSLGAHLGTAALKAAVKDARNQQGAIIVAAAGNDHGDGPDPCSWPAAYSQTIAVAAVKHDLKRASFSTVATYVDIAAPGVSIVSTCPVPQLPQFLVNGDPTRCTPNEEGYAAGSGTSMAAPFVSAAAAMFVELCPALVGKTSHNTFKQLLQDRAKPLAQHPYKVGAGLVQPNKLTAAVESACSP